jgi:hypothetical protein
VAAALVDVGFFAAGFLSSESELSSEEDSFLAAALAGAAAGLEKVAAALVAAGFSSSESELSSEEDSFFEAAGFTCAAAGFAATPAGGLGAVGFFEAGSSSELSSSLDEDSFLLLLTGPTGTVGLAACVASFLLVTSFRVVSLEVEATLLSSLLLSSEESAFLTAAA